jgi:RsiW-degrading membrane proteinase PrsW (M82 family)
MKNMVRPCATNRAVTIVLFGSAIAVALLVYRAIVINIQKRDNRTASPPYSILTALIPHIVALCLAVYTVVTAEANFDREFSAYKSSKMTATDWISARTQDNRTRSTLITSLLSSMVVAGASIFNTQVSVNSRK